MTQQVGHDDVIAARPLPVRRSAGGGSVFTDVDLCASGRQIGFFSVPQSPHDDAWGTVRIPIAVIANGTGPTILIEGSNHGRSSPPAR